MGKRFIITSIILICITLVMYIATFVPLYARIVKTPSDRTDILLHKGFLEDYAIYLGTITRGQFGLLFRNYYSTQNIPPLPLYSYYTVAGFLSRPFNISPVYVYHAARLFALIFFGISMALICAVFTKNITETVLTSLFIYVFPNMPEFFYSNQTVASFTPWWRALDAFGRFDDYPHYTMAKACALLSISFIFYYSQNKNVAWLFYFAIFSFLTVLMVPYAVIPVLLAVGVLLLHYAYTWIVSKQLRYFKIIILLLFVCLPSIVILIYFSLIGVYDPVWEAYKIWQVGFWNRDAFFVYHFYAVFFLYGLLSIPALFISIKKRSIKGIYLFVWAFVPLFLSGLVDLIGMGKGRLFHIYHYIPLGILSCVTIVYVFHYIRKKYIRGILVFVFFFISVFIIIVSIKQKYDSVLVEVLSRSYYISTDRYNTAWWIRKNIMPESKFMALSDIRNTIPSFAPIIMYAGDQTNGYNWDLDTTQVYRFYRGQMNTSEAYKFIKSKGIQFVIGDYESSLTSLLPIYTFLKLVRDEEFIQIYSVL